MTEQARDALLDLILSFLDDRVFYYLKEHKKLMSLSSEIDPFYWVHLTFEYEGLPEVVFQKSIDLANEPVGNLLHWVDCIALATVEEAHNTLEEQFKGTWEGVECAITDQFSKEA